MRVPVYSGIYNCADNDYKYIDRTRLNEEEIQNKRIKELGIEPYQFDFKKSEKTEKVEFIQSMAVNKAIALIALGEEVPRNLARAVCNLNGVEYNDELIGKEAVVSIYSTSNLLNRREIIMDCESFFDARISTMKMSKDSIEAMYAIDKAEIVDKKLGTIKTPIGVCSRKDLSSGCKTVLSYIYVVENYADFNGIKAVDATECGWNALEQLFKYIEKHRTTRVAVVIEHGDELYKCGNRNYIVDGVVRDRIYDIH